MKAILLSLNKQTNKQTNGCHVSVQNSSPENQHFTTLGDIKWLLTTKGKINNCCIRSDHLVKLNNEYFYFRMFRVSGDLKKIFIKKWGKTAIAITT